MKGFSITGSIVHSLNFDEGSLIQKLPPRVYTLSADINGLFLVITQDKFILDEVYGSTITRADKIIATYNDRSTQTGVLATGDKGSGKSLLTKVVANKFIENGLPVIIINSAFKGNGFNTIMNEIGECLVIFDEFAKIYANEEDSNSNQDALLTFFDGVSSTKRLCMITENYEWHINEFLRNRPGRMYYHFKYGKLDVTTIKEVCEIKLKTNRLNEILEIVATSAEFSFDTLQAIIEESNRYPNETIATIVEDLNITITNGITTAYKISKVENSTKQICKLTNPEQIFKAFNEGKPGVVDPTLNKQIQIQLYHSTLEYEKDNKVIVACDGYMLYMEKIEQLPINYNVF